MAPEHSRGTMHKVQQGQCGAFQGLSGVLLLMTTRAHAGAQLGACPTIIVKLRVFHTCGP